MDLLDFGDKEPAAPQSNTAKIADEIDNLLARDTQGEPRFEDLGRSAVQPPDTKTDTEPSESSSSVFAATATQEQLLERQAKLMQKAVARNNQIVER